MWIVFNVVQRITWRIEEKIYVANAFMTELFVY